MKLKRSKAMSVFFLLSFFISISTNICLASFFAPIDLSSSQTKDHLHFNEGLVTFNINDLLFEENENEDENELDLDLSSILIPFFLETLSSNKKREAFDHRSPIAASAQQPIYLKVSNFRI
jgi:hypothetical protein